MFVRPVLRMDQTSWVDAHVEAFAFFGGVPGPAGAGQPEDRRRPARPLRPEDQPGLCRARRPLRRAGRPGPGVQTEGQAPGRAADAVCAGLVLAGPGVHLAGRRCRPRRSAGADRSPDAGRTGRWTAPARCRCSTPSRPRRCSRCRAARSCWPPGRPRRSARTSTSRSAEPSTRCPGGSSASRSTPARPRPWCRSSTSGELVKTHAAAAPGPSHRLRATTRRRRSRSRCAPRPGAGSRPPKIGPATAAVIDQLLEVNALHRLRAAQGVLGLAARPRRRTPGWKPPATGRSTSATRPTAPSKASSPPAPRRRPGQHHRPRRSSPAYLHGPDELLACDHSPAPADDAPTHAAMVHDRTDRKLVHDHP